MATIGIDIGGTKIASAVFQPGSAELQFPKTSATPHEPTLFVDTLVEHIERLKVKEPNTSAVGIATAGVVDSQLGEILGSTGNLPALSGVPSLRKALEARCKLPVFIENDANAAAYGECRAGAAKDMTAQGYGDVLMVTLGTGVGTGIVVHNQLVRGAHFFAGEGGHIAISMNKDRKCTCGRWDCWEAYASGTGLTQTIRLTMRQVLSAARTPFWRQFDDTETLTTHNLFAGVAVQDPIALQIVDQWHEHIAAGLGSVLNLLDPAVVVIGGGLCEFVDFTQLLRLTRPRSMNPDIRLVKASLGNMAGMVGAACIAWEKTAATQPLLSAEASLSSLY
jgi:glucokinase